MFRRDNVWPVMRVPAARVPCACAPANGRVMIAVKYLLILIPLFCMQFCRGSSHRIGLVTITSLSIIVLRRPTLFVWFPDYKLYLQSTDNVFTLWLLINSLISHWLLINLPAYQCCIISTIILYQLQSQVLHTQSEWTRDFKVKNHLDSHKT